MGKLGRYGFFLQLIGMPLSFLVASGFPQGDGFTKGLASVVLGLIGWVALALAGIILGCFEIRATNSYAAECKDLGVEPPKRSLTFAFLSIGIGVIPLVLALAFFLQQV